MEERDQRIRAVLGEVEADYAMWLVSTAIGEPSQLLEDRIHDRLMDLPTEDLVRAVVLLLGDLGTPKAIATRIVGSVQ